MTVKISEDVVFGKSKPFVLISGPCVIESESHCLFMAEKIKNICCDLNIPYIFKSSFDKANRTALNHYRGTSLNNANKIFQKIKQELDVPITTDFHEVWQANELKGSVDLLQIPAFLCRQTDLLIAAAKTKLPVNIKKAQFVSGYDMEKAVNKVKLSANNKILLTERGNVNGYGDFIVDMRNLVIMKDFAPVIFDATHSVQKGCSGGSQGSNIKFIEPLCKAAAAIGVSGLFLESHDNPQEALSDGSSSIKLSNLKDTLSSILDLIS